MKTFTMNVATTQEEVLALGKKYGLNFSGGNAAAAERLGPFEALVFACVNDFDEEPGYRVNVLVMNNDGLADQWVSEDTELQFGNAVNMVADVATLPLGDFVEYLSSKARKIT
jgi:hypothetical protein